MAALAMVTALVVATAVPADASSAKKKIYAGDECTHTLSGSPIGTASFHRNGKHLNTRVSGTIPANSDYYLAIYKKTGSSCDLVYSTGTFQSDGAGAFELSSFNSEFPKKVTTFFAVIVDQTHGHGYETHYVHLDP